jgi:hypothetical protein
MAHMKRIHACLIYKLAPLFVYAAGIEFNAGSLSTAAGFQCMSGDLREVVGLMSEVVRSPQWSGEKLALFREQVVSMIDHQNDDPSSVASRLLLRQMYGPGSVYARQATKAGIASIGVDDLRSFAAAWQVGAKQAGVQGGRVVGTTGGTIYGDLMVLWWCFGGALLVPWWCSDGALMLL